MILFPEKVPFRATLSFLLLVMGSLPSLAIDPVTEDVMIPSSSMGCSLPTSLPSCSFQVAESIPEGLVFQTGPVFNSTFDELKNLVDSATSTLDIASFYWTLKNRDVTPDHEPSAEPGEHLLDAIIAAAKRGVAVRIAVNSGNRFSEGEDLKELVQAGAVFRPVNFTHLMHAGVLHTKFIIGDNTTFYVGSANMDWRSLTQVKEMGVVVSCAPLAQDLGKIFEIYWMLGGRPDDPNPNFPSSYPEYLNTQINAKNPLAVNLGGSPSHVFLSSSPLPFNTQGRTNDIDAILDTINGAQKFINIAVMDYYPIFLFGKKNYWPVIDDALRRAVVERDVTVRLLASKWNSTRSSMKFFLRSLNQLDGFSKKGGSIQTKMFVVPQDPPIPFARVNHNKYMVTDRTGYVGTSNWSADYFVNTGGVAFVSHQDNTCYAKSSLRSLLVEAFERDWNSQYAGPVQ